MKTIFRNNLYIYILLSFILGSCNSFLDKAPDDAITLEMIFNDKKRAEEWLAAIYDNIPDALMDYNRNLGYVFMSDDAQASIAMGQFYGEWQWIITNNQGGLNPTMKPKAERNLWLRTYKDVRSALIFIENIKPLPLQNLSMEEVTQMKMEARFLIAFYYHKLIEQFGPVPLITHLLDAETPITEMSFPRTPMNEIIEWIDQQYLDLSNYFPAQYHNPDMMFGRPNKGICLALRARLWLYAASPLFNGNSDFKDVKNHDGTPLFTQEPNIELWKKAAETTREFLDLAETGIYSLCVERHPNGEIDPFQSLQNIFTTLGSVNKEIIFARSSNSHQWYHRVCNPRGYAGQAGYFGATQNLVDAFHMKNGLPPILGYNKDLSPIINESSGYTEEGFSTEEIIYPNTLYDLGGESRKPGLVSDKGTFNMYVNREPRFYLSVWHNDQWIPGAKRKTDFKSGGVDGGPTHDSPQCGYLNRKAINPETDPRNNKYLYQPAIILRLAEFYLNYAEALNEFNPQNPDILLYLNMIRERAGIPGYGSESIPTPKTQNEMRDAIRREKRVEFALEGDIRYNDLRRWKIAEEVFKTPIMGMDRSASNNTDFYKRTIYMHRVFDKKNYLYPILQDYLDNNPNLVQNKFW